MPNRRMFLSFLLLPAVPAMALAATLDPAEFDIRPDVPDDQSDAFRALLAEASARRLPVVLPPGDYAVSEIALPDGLVMTGTAGASRLVLSRPGPLVIARDSARLTLGDMVFDAAGQRANGDVEGLVDLRGVARLALSGCTVSGGGAHGLYAERCGGRILSNDISGAAQSGIFAVDSARLSIAGNVVADCGNGGILVHRWEKGEDGTMVSGNRISGIRALSGGTGENGNGINLYRAGNVMVTGNHISDCAFSAIRANASDDVTMSSNHCLRSGETAIYAEFGFEGALVNSNLIDGAANGILIVNFNDGGRLASIAGNIVRNLKDKGPYNHDGAGFGFGIAVEADTVVTGNVIEDAPKWGLMLGWGPYLRNVVATGNLVRRAGAGCAVTVVEGAGTAAISGNIFQAVDAGILGYRWNERTTGDLMAAGEAQYAHLTIEGNRLVR